MNQPNLKIEGIEIYQSRIKLKAPFIISLGTLEHAENIFIVIHTNAGIKGFGECSPFQTIHGETMQTCSIVGAMIGKALLGTSPLDIQQCNETMNSLIFGNTSIKSAFDMALYDIAAKHAQLPLYAFLHGKNDKVLITDYTISLGNADKMAGEAKEIVQRGFQFIKIKLGESAEKDVERIQAIRQTIGSEVPLRIDANQGWDKATALTCLNLLKNMNIQHCEEPIPRWDFMNLPSIRALSPIPIMSDESCCNHHDAKRLIYLDACDSLNVKLGKSGGILEALKIIHLAEEAKMPMQMGGFLESRLGFTASAHLALSSDRMLHFDFDTPLMFEKDPVKGGIIYHHGGRITVPDLPGLGAEIEETYLSGLPKITV